MNDAGCSSRDSIAPRLISLVGLPGVGKSTVGRRLARKLDCEFADCDAILEDRLQCRIREFFEVEGEARFREIESRLLHELMERTDAVIATGGGIVLRQDNRDLLRQRTVCVYLQARPESLIHRLRTDVKRPLLQGGDPEGRLRQLAIEREPLYREVAANEIAAGVRSLHALTESLLRQLPARAGSGAESVDPSAR